MSSPPPLTRVPKIKLAFQQWILGISLSVLVLALGMLGFGNLGDKAQPGFKANLAAVLPSPEEVPGWVMQKEQIATTPEIKRAVSELLNYDDAVFVSYICENKRISVYLAYWRPGKMLQQNISDHTPDVCWVRNGWEVIQTSQATIPRKNLRMAASHAEERVMRLGAASERVLFWHIVDGVVPAYSKARPPWYWFLNNLFQRGLKQKREQLFVRISSPIENVSLWDSAVVLSLCEKLQPEIIMPPK